MVSFLTTLILALIIFVPACYLSSKILFRTSEQAKDNYVEFVKELVDFAKDAPLGARKSIILIMDEATAIVSFEQNKQEVIVNVDARFDYSDFTIHLQKPGQCSDAQNCLCLIRKANFDVTAIDDVTVTGLMGKIVVIPQRVICTDLDFNLEVETCSIGKPEAVNSYVCSNGFMIERHLTDEASVAVASYYELPRRTVLYFSKFEDTVRLEGDYGGSESS